MLQKICCIHSKDTEYYLPDFPVFQKLLARCIAISIIFITTNCHLQIVIFIDFVIIVASAMGLSRVAN